MVVGTISLAAAGTSIAAAVGAFAPDNPGGNGTESTVAPQQQIIDLQTNLATLAAQEKKVESDLAVSQAASKKWQYAAIGVGVIAVVAAAFIAMEKNKKS